jgi:ORF6N domain-containing protein
MTKSLATVAAERIEQAIFFIRGERVMLDFDLAALYQVTTKALNQAVRRNRERFPEDFTFQLTPKESAELDRSQIVTGSQKHRDPRFRPYAFTELGVAMLSSVLRSKRAALVNVAIMRAFVKLRQLLASHADLARKLEDLERKYDAQFKVVFDAIRQLMTPPEPKRKQIGFHAKSLKR